MFNPAVVKIGDVEYHAPQEVAAEVELLRAALRRFVDMPETFPEDQFLDGWRLMREAFANAKAVLRSVPDKGVEP